MAPNRKVSLILKIDADSREDLSRSLFNLSHQVEREGLHGVGVSGSPSAGYVYSYTEPEDGLEHNEYFRQLAAHLSSSDPAGEKS